MGVRDESPLYDEVPGLEEQGFFNALIDLRRIKEQKVALEADEKRLALEIEAMLITTDQKRVRLDNFCVERSSGRSPAKVDPQLLLGQGVSPAIINECTIPGKEYTYIQIIDLTKKQKGQPQENSAT